MRVRGVRSLELYGIRRLAKCGRNADHLQIRQYLAQCLLRLGDAVLLRAFATDESYAAVSEDDELLRQCNRTRARRHLSSYRQLEGSVPPCGASSFCSSPPRIDAALRRSCSVVCCLIKCVTDSYSHPSTG